MYLKVIIFVFILINILYSQGSDLTSTCPYIEEMYLKIFEKCNGDMKCINDYNNENNSNYNNSIPTGSMIIRDLKNCNDLYKVEDTHDCSYSDIWIACFDGYYESGKYGRSFCSLKKCDEHINNNKQGLNKCFNRMSCPGQAG